MSVPKYWPTQIRPILHWQMMVFLRFFNSPTISLPGWSACNCLVFWGVVVQPVKQLSNKKNLKAADPWSAAMGVQGAHCLWSTLIDLMKSMNHVDKPTLNIHPFCWTAWCCQENWIFPDFPGWRAPPLSVACSTGFNIFQPSLDPQSTDG